VSEFAKDAFGFLIGCVAVAVVVFAFWGGLALVMHNGQSQSCSNNGGHWVATDKPQGGGSLHERECRR
jgi:hypothetical protein